jgi:DHA1 family chloramphenicol resistance protein-like MFS transporter
MMQSGEKQSKQNRNLALLGAAHSLNHSLFVITPPLLSMIMTGLGVTKLEIGLASTIASMIYGAGALLGGPLGDRIGEVKAIAICLAMAGLPAPLMLVAGFALGFYVYAGTLAFMAFWASLYHPIANSFISKVFKIRVYEAMGLHGVGGTLGIVLAPTVAWFLGASFGWPWAFVFFGALSTILAVVFAKVATRPEAVSGSGGTRLSEALKIRSLSMVLVLNVTIGLFMKGVELFFPTYLKEVRGVSDMWASVAYTLVLTFGVAGQWIGGKTASGMGPRKVVIITMAGICVGMVSLLFAPIHIVGIAVFIVLYGLSFYGHQPALNALMGFLAPYNQRGAVFGIYFFTSFGIGSVSQLIAGYVADVYGLDVAFYLLTVFAIAALLLSFTLPSRTEK